MSVGQRRREPDYRVVDEEDFLTTVETPLGELDAAALEPGHSGNGSFETSKLGAGRRPPRRSALARTAASATVGAVLGLLVVLICSGVIAGRTGEGAGRPTGAVATAPSSGPAASIATTPLPARAPRVRVRRRSARSAAIGRRGSGGLNAALRRATVAASTMAVEEAQASGEAPIEFGFER